MTDAVVTDSSIESGGQKGSVLGGTVIVAGTAVGAGMFSLPVATSGLWFGYSLILMLFVWFCMYSAALYLMEANLRFPLGASFDTIAEGTIGHAGRLINGASIAFLCYILTYAYISGGSSIVSYSLDSIGGISVTRPVASLMFALVLSFIVILGTRAVDKVTTALIGGMAISFLMSVGGLMEQVDTVNLFPELPASERLPFTFTALSFFAVSFGMQTCVPSITKYLNKDTGRVRRALLWGSLLTATFYALWQFSVLGNISREEFPALITSGGNIGDIVAALAAKGLANNIAGALKLFSNMAVASSFLGVSLCLYDYIADLFDFKDDITGRLKTAAITFLPPTLLGALLPNGFITAIGFAGLVMVIICILSPVLMAWAGRKQAVDGYQVPGGKARMLLVLGFGLVTMLLAALDILGMLPKFG